MLPTSSLTETFSLKRGSELSSSLTCAGTGPAAGLAFKGREGPGTGILTSLCLALGDSVPDLDKYM